MLKLLDLSLTSPAENLALDEALLETCERSGEEVLRFWESPTYFIVLGYSNHVQEEVFVDRCKERKIDILRRVSGGGTVLQGPGCLNYSLILRVNRPGLETVTSTNHSIMSRLRVALAKHLHQPITIEGHTDLAIRRLKFSGNAQRRKRNALLFHGTFLMNFDFEQMESILKPPPREPEYRAGRSHRDFLMNLNEDTGTLKSALVKTWEAHKILSHIPRESILRLATEKYSTSEWNYKF